MNSRPLPYTFLLYLLLLLIIPLPSLKAQELQLKGQYVYRHFLTSNSSLTTNELYKVIPDKNGYIWLATDKGLLRYDGIAFQQVTGPNVQGSIVSVYLDSRDRLWLFTYTGRIGAVDLNTQTVLPVDSLYGLDSRYNDGTPWLMAQETKDTLYVFKYCSKLLSIPLNGGKAVFSDNGTDRFGDNTFARIIAGRWFEPGLLNAIKMREGACPRRPYMMQTRRSSLTYYNQVVQTGSQPRLLFDGNKAGIRDYLIGFAFNGKDLYTAGLEQESLWLFPAYDRQKADSAAAIRLLQQVQVSDIAVDYLGNTWVATLKDGIYLFGRGASAVQQYNREHSGLSSDLVTCFRPLSSGRALAGYANGTWDLIHPDGSISPGHNEVQQGPRNEVQFVFPLKEQTLLIFRFQVSLLGNDGLNATTPAEWASLQVKDAVKFRDEVYFTVKGRQYICDQEGHVRSFFNGLNNTISICPVADSVIYYGTTLGLFRNGTKVVDFPDMQINKVRRSGSSLLMATKEGLYRCRMDRSFRIEGRPEQIARQECADIKEYDGVLYVHTDEGLLLLDARELRPLGTFNQRRFAIPVTINDYTIDSGYVYLSTGNGLFRFDRKKFLPGLQQDSINIFLHPATSFCPSDSVIKVIYNEQNSISLLLDVLYYPEEPRTIEYKIYRDGNEVSSWIPAASHLITLTEPQPGKYRIAFRIFIAGNNRMFYYEKEVVVLPLWYQAWWCRLLVVLTVVSLLALLVYFWYRQRLSRINALHEEQLYFVDMEARNRTMQLKPHHLSGLMVPIRQYLSGKVDGLAYLDRFSSLMQQLLAEQCQELTPLERELAFLKEYLALQQQRFHNSFHYTLDISAVEGLDALQIPSLVIYPLVENAIEHGVQGLERQGHVQVILTPAGPGSILVTVKDNGKGLQGHKFRSTDHAMQLLSERLALLQKKYGTGSIRSRDSADGLEVMVLLPLVPQE